MRPHLIIMVALALIAGVQPDLAATRKKSEIRLYSSICVHPESGDLLGARIVVLRFAEGDYAYFQQAEGETTTTYASTAQISNNSTIEFEIPGASQKPVTFRGTMTDKALSGKFDKGAEIFTLPRTHLGQVGYPPCR